MGDSLFAAWRLNIKVLTPLHVGTGTKLMDGYDFTARGGKTYRLNVDAILDDVWPDDPAQQDQMLKQPPAELLIPEHFDHRPEFFWYVLEGEPVGTKREVNECIKDAEGRPYIPGSTLKGAFRTALLQAVEHAPLEVAKASQATDPRKVAQFMEHDRFGRSPNTDILRALRVADSAPFPPSVLRLQAIQMVPNLMVNVEAIAPGAETEVDVSLDAWLLGQRGRRGLAWHDDVLGSVSRFLETARRKAGERVAFEYEYHKKQHKGFRRAEDAGCLGFYETMVKRLLDKETTGFPIQIGFATGWRAKTVLGLIEPDDRLGPIIRKYGLDRGGRGRGSWREGQPFPKARHVARTGGQCFWPVGWVWVQYTRIR